MHGSTFGAGHEVPLLRYWAIAALLASIAAAADYRIDCATRNLDEVNAIELRPGDRLLFRAGCRWTGTLAPRGSGSDAAPIRMGRYGEGPPPIVDGGGAETAILLRNREFWEISDLEIVNNAAEPGVRRGVLVRAENLGRALHHIYLRRLDIHHVKGKLGTDMISRCTGGIGFEVLTNKNLPASTISGSKAATSTPWITWGSTSIRTLARTRAIRRGTNYGTPAS